MSEERVTAVGRSARSGGRWAGNGRGGGGGTGAVRWGGVGVVVWVGGERGDNGNFAYLDWSFRSV